MAQRGELESDLLVHLPEKVPLDAGDEDNVASGFHQGAGYGIKLSG